MCAMIIKIKKKIRWAIRVLNKQIHKNYPSFIHIYKQRKHVENTHRPLEKLNLLTKSLYDAYIKRKTILFYPDNPVEFHALYKTLMYLGYRISTNPKNRFNIAIKWWLAFDGNPFAPEAIQNIENMDMDKSIQKINQNCSDISKENINSIFDKVFPYSITIDPSTYNGKCVMKSNWNALHEGQVINCPVEKITENVVYQKLINNETENGYVEDMRVPIFKDTIPFVYLKYRKIKDRFVDRGHTGVKATIVDCFDVLTKEELQMILKFCKKLGLDYGELDVLRDKYDGRIYIVDANNTPAGPTSAIGIHDGRRAVLKMANAFKQAFGV